jgi:hypothetical protein
MSASLEIIQGLVGVESGTQGPGSGLLALRLLMDVGRQK